MWIITNHRNYGSVPEKVSKGSPVYLTRNGHGVYSIRDAEVMIQLLCELNAGIRSAEEDGWIPEEDMRAYIHKGR